MGMFRNSQRLLDSRVPVDMTPMIDVVFQLLAFFMMSLRIIDAEGDFEVRMPVLGTKPGPVETLSPMRVQLQASSTGGLAGVRLNERSFTRLDDLRRHLASIVGEPGPGGQLSPEVEIECDYNLNYEHAMAAITAISGERLADGKIAKLIEKIRFAPPVHPPRSDRLN